MGCAAQTVFERKSSCFIHQFDDFRKTHAYLDEVEQQATALFLRLVKELSEKEDVTESLKATDQMAWVQKMNNIRNRATEIVNAEMIYTV